MNDVLKLQTKPSLTPRKPAQQAGGGGGSSSSSSSSNFKSFFSIFCK